VTNSLLSASVTRPAGTQKPRPARTGAPAGARLGDVPPPVFGAAAIRAFIKTGDQGWSVSEGSFGDRHVWIARRDVPAAEESAFSKGAGTEVHGPLTVECRIDEATGLVVRWALLSGDTVVWQVRLDDLQVNPTAWPTELPTSLPTDAPASTTGAAGAGQ